VLKYAVFALAVCVPGCVLGVAVGSNLFPTLIFNHGYKMLYLMPDLLLRLRWEYCALAFGISLLSVLVPTLAVCGAELADVPAVLLRPKPPRSGKRILLERVRFVWRRMSFSAKVTARNILRYKKRFLMTVTGVMGCTAIVLTGFGLRDSISVIAERQFGTIFLHDMEISLKEDPSAADVDALNELMRSSPEIVEFVYCHRDTYDANTNEVFVCVPEDVDAFARFVRLRDPDSKEIRPLAGDGALVTQKLAKLMGVKPGDMMILLDADGGSVELPVSAVVENYAAHYVYLTPEGFRRMFGQEAAYNTILCLAPEVDSDAQAGTGAKLLDNGAVNGLSFLARSRAFYTDMVTTMNFVVLVLIVAGALLSFIVLFSLTGINIDERERELATLKVLGFYEGETAKYIFRENIITNLIGTLAGLPAGIGLHRLIILTVEVDMVMFGREILPISFVITVALSFLFLLFVNWIMGFHIRKIDMIESLKSVE
jgi:putative ABC transport system permease protein